MSRRVEDDRLEVIHLQVSGELRRGASNDARKRAEGKPIEPLWVTLDARSLSPLLDELRQRRRRAGTFGAKGYGLTTQTLMRMAVGETVEYPPITQPALTTARATARKALGIPDANWHSETQANGYVKITRLPDGSAKVYGKPRNPAVAQMAAMLVGQTVTITTLPGKMHNGIKAQARAKLDFAGAQWKCENLANGDIRCKRVS